MHTEQSGPEPGQQINGAEQPMPAPTSHVDDVIAAQAKVEQGRAKAIEILLNDKAAIDTKLRALGHKIFGKPRRSRATKIVPDAPAETAPKPTGKARGGK